MSKHIVITGTSRGIGLELVKILAASGNKILSLSRNKQPVEELQLPNVIALSFDLSQTEAYNHVHTIVEKEWKNQVDVIIHNAGLLVNKPFEALQIQDWQQVYQVNVFGVAQLTQLLVPCMKKGSHVLTISSMGGIQGSMKFPGLAAYSSSKGAVITLSELLAEEYKDKGIAFNVLALGAVQTEMLEEAFPGYEAPLTANEMASYIANFSLTGQLYYNGKVLEVSSSTP